MALKEDLEAQVKKIFREAWERREGIVVPESEDLKLGNEVVTLDATVLYADLTASTHLVDTSAPTFAAEVYKTFLHCAAKLVTSEGGVITAYDGDRIMAVYLGNFKNTSAARTALKINYAALYIINPALKAQYPAQEYAVRHTVGVDTSDLMVARTGIRGSNDLVWVGRAANYAAKLTELTSDYPSRVTGDVYDHLNAEVKVSSDGRDIWEQRSWTVMNDMRIFRSNWWWRI